MTEKVILVDNNDQEIGIEEKNKAHQKGKTHKKIGDPHHNLVNDSPDKSPYSSNQDSDKRGRAHHDDPNPKSRSTAPDKTIENIIAPACRSKRSSLRRRFWHRRESYTGNKIRISLVFRRGNHRGKESNNQPQEDKNESGESKRIFYNFQERFHILFIPASLLDLA